MSTPINFNGSIPQHYEDLLTPFLFEGFAEDLAGRSSVGEHAWVLELACGTGCLTRELYRRLPVSAQFIASDLQPGMLDVAKQSLPDKRITWATVNMLNTPYEDALFHQVFCQFGIMLVPDPLAVLQEIRRILRPGGRLLFNVWADIHRNGIWATGARVLDAFLPDNPLLQDPGPFALDERTTLELLHNAGFTATGAQYVRKEGISPSAAKAARGFIRGLPVIQAIEKHNTQLVSAIEQTLTTELIQTFGDHPLVSPLEAIVFDAYTSPSN